MKRLLLVLLASILLCITPVIAQDNVPTDAQYEQFIKSVDDDCDGVTLWERFLIFVQFGEWFDWDIDAGK